MVRSVMVMCILVGSLVFTAPAWAKYENYLPPAGRCAGAESNRGTTAQQEAAMRCLINYARAKQSLRQLKASPLLARSTDFKARDIVRCDEFSHTACGKSMMSVFQKVGYPKGSWAAGENIAWAGPTTTMAPRGIMLMWLNSSGHRHNILSKTWTEQGVGLVDNRRFQGYSGAEVWVSHFGTRS